MIPSPNSCIFHYDGNNSNRAWLAYKQTTKTIYMPIANRCTNGDAPAKESFAHGVAILSSSNTYYPASLCIRAMLLIVQLANHQVYPSTYKGIYTILEVYRLIYKIWCCRVMYFRGSFGINYLSVFHYDSQPNIKD